MNPFQPGQPYTYNGIDIPSQQTLPPAGAPTIAFRPSCTQLSTVAQNPSEAFPMGSIQYGVQNPNTDQIIILAEYPTGLDQATAHLYLDSEGNCKVGGVDVPIAFVEQLPKPVVTQPTATTGDTVAPAQEGSAVNGSMIVGGVALVAAAIAYAVYTYQKRPVGQSTQSTTGQSPLQELMEMMQKPSDGGSSDAGE